MVFSAFTFSQGIFFLKNVSQELEIFKPLWPQLDWEVLSLETEHAGCISQLTCVCFSLSPLQAKKKKNISHNVFGTKFGRVHMQKQDLAKLQTRKMKGLRKRRGDVVAEDQDAQAPKVVKVDSSAAEAPVHQTDMC